jgi:two-component system, NtrC family, sensor kinase
LLNRTNELNELLDIILSETEKIFDVEGTSILLEDKSSGQMYFYVATGEKKEILHTIKMERGEGICGYVFETNKVLLENNPSDSTLFSDKVDKKSKFITKNILCVPLALKDNPIGVLELVNKIESEFNDNDVEFLKAVAAQVSLALERARLHEEKVRSERLATIGETVAGLSHCIKNILNGLKGGAFIVNKNLPKDGNFKIHTGWNIVQKNIDKISGLTLDMLQYSKDREPDYEKADIKELITDVTDLLQERFNEKKIRLNLHFDDDLNDVDIESKGIHRCVLNLVSNSIDAFETDVGNILTIKTEKNNSDFDISIEDNGCGINEENRKKLFTKFFSTKGSAGTGLGLPVTKKIIEEHGGKLTVKSTENIGTTFIINLPNNRRENGA